MELIVDRGVWHKHLWMCVFRFYCQFSSWLTILVSPNFKEIFSLIRTFSRSTKVWCYRLWVQQEVIICVIFS